MGAQYGDTRCDYQLEPQTITFVLLSHTPRDSRYHVALGTCRVITSWNPRQ